MASYVIHINEDQRKMIVEALVNLAIGIEGTAEEPAENDQHHPLVIASMLDLDGPYALVPAVTAEDLRKNPHAQSPLNGLCS